MNREDEAGLIFTFAPIVAGSCLIALAYMLEPEIKIQFKALPSPICWPGGKRLLVKELLKRIPPHRIYVEPFAGGAKLFFAKEPAEINILNDLNRNLMLFYDALRRGFNPAKCDMAPHPEKFEQARQRLDDPCNFFYVNKWSFSCNMEDYSPRKRGSRSKQCTENPSKCFTATPSRYAEAWQEKLSKAKLHATDFREVLNAYDSPDTFFYLDPPYWGANQKECLYGEYCGVTPEEVAEAVKNLKGKVLISYDLHPRVVEAFSRLGPKWRMEKVKVMYSMEQKRGENAKNRIAEELLIRNYD